MIIEDRNDAILVKIIDLNDDTGVETLVSAYYTTAINETLKMFITAKDYHIDIGFNEFSEVVDKKYKQMTYLVKAVYIGAGSSDDIPVIRVYI